VETLPRAVFEPVFARLVPTFDAAGTLQSFKLAYRPN
jgi:hypothetical protein